MRPPARLILTGAALLVVAACNNDATVAPSLSAPPRVLGSAALAALATPSTVDFVIPVAGGHVAILGGVYNLDVSANAVCDPNAQDSRDGYAAAAWDSSCTPATADITVHATLQWSHNRMWVDFSPALRFVPTQTVTVSTDLLSPAVRFYGQDAAGAIGDNSNGRSKDWGILYAPVIDGKPIDDSKNDLSVRTTIDFGTGRISRRIKHFSGYNILTSQACIVSPDDPYCVEFGDGHP